LPKTAPPPLDPTPALPKTASSYTDGDYSPKGEILHSGVCGKAGGGLLANKFTNRFVVIHRIEGVSYMSVYDASCATATSGGEFTELKGSRLLLDERASVTTEGPKFIVRARDEKTSVAQETITQSYTSVEISIPFKAATDEEAAQWAAAVQQAISGQ
jgi:hypothetical protein